MLTRRTLIISAVAGVVVIAVAIGAFFVWSYTQKQEVSTEEPVEIVRGFYQPWLDAAQSTTTDPYKEGLENSPILSKELRKGIKKAHSEGGVDPVLCQSTVPDNIGTRIVFEAEDKIEVLVTARQSSSTEQAIVALLPLNGGWYIDGIRCSPGEFLPDREFSFDREGYLLKDVPEPLDPQYWHIIFEENGELGHFAPLFFTAESMCSALDKSTAVCNPDTLVPVSKVRVQGQMTELGVEVTRLESLKESR